MIRGMKDTLFILFCSMTSNGKKEEMKCKDKCLVKKTSSDVSVFHTHCVRFI